MANSLLRKVLIPADHGSWALVGSPILLGLLLTPGLAPALVAGAVFCGFLARQPIRFWLTDRLRGKAYPRTKTALSASIVLVAAAAVLLGSAFVQRSGWWWVWLVVAGCLALPELILELKGKRGNIWPQAIAAGGIAYAAAAITSIGGLELRPSAHTAILLSFDMTNAILYVHRRLRPEEGGPKLKKTMVVAHAHAIMVSTFMVLGGTITPLAPIAFAVLLGRALWGTSSKARQVPTPVVGVQETLYRIMLVLVLAFG